MKALLGIAGGFVLTLAVFASGLGFATWLLAAKPVRQATPTIGVSELWARDARPVDPAKQALERIPAQQAAGAPTKVGEATKASGKPEIAAFATPLQPQLQPGASAASPPASGGDVAQSSGQADAQAPQEQAQLPVAHLQWCANRYRSYRPEENSYRSYSGEVRPCVSPYFDPDGDRTASTEQNGTAGQVDTADDEAETLGYAPLRDGYARTYGGPPEEIAPDQEQASGEGRLPDDHVDYCFSRYRSYDPQDNTYQPFDGGPRRQCQ